MRLKQFFRGGQVRLIKTLHFNVKSGQFYKPITTTRCAVDPVSNTKYTVLQDSCAKVENFKKNNSNKRT